MKKSEREFLRGPAKPSSTGRIWTFDDGRPGRRQRPQIVIPPFTVHMGHLQRRRLVEHVVGNGALHPTDVVVDASVFSPERTALARELLISCRPIVLPAVERELEDMRSKPKLDEVCSIVFKDGALHPWFRRDELGVIGKYERLAMRYMSLLHWRKDAIGVEARRVARETGAQPVGKARSKLIRQLAASGVGADTLELANKDHRPDRVADEVLAVFSVLSPIVTGRDCVLLTADEDLFNQAIRLSEMIFDDYGAYSICKHLRENPGYYDHRHVGTSMFFEGAVEAIGRKAHPDYLLPPVPVTETCATHVIDVVRLRAWTWISARNMEPAIDFQNGDALGRKGDPADGLSVMFTAPREPGVEDVCGKNVFHFLVGKAKPLRTEGPDFGPIPLFDLFRSQVERGADRRDKSRLVTLHQHERARIEAATRGRLVTRSRD